MATDPEATAAAKLRQQHERLLKNYRDLCSAVRMLRLTMEQVMGADAELPASNQIITMPEECEAMARALVAFAAKRDAR